MKEPLVEILKKETVFDNIFRVVKTRLRFRKFDDTMSQEVTRLVFERGLSVAALLYNTETQKFLLIQQFRYPAYMENNPERAWLAEIVAGKIDPGETPRQAATREIREEIGYEVPLLDFVFDFYPSPGASSERISLFYGEVTNADKVADAHGIATEHEDIRLLEISYEEAMQFLHMHPGPFDAKTLIALQWLELKRHRTYAYNTLQHL